MRRLSRGYRPQQLQEPDFARRTAEGGCPLRTIGVQAGAGATELRDPAMRMVWKSSGEDCAWHR